MLPTFLIVGAPKAGSSMLYNQLANHPQIVMGGKELNFFVKNWNLGLDFYESKFPNRENTLAAGEASINYMAETIAAPRIKQSIPDVNIIFTLRNPIDRAVSHYWHRIKTNREKNPLHFLLFDNSCSYLTCNSRYYSHIERFQKFFSKDQIYINILERMSNSFEDEFKKLFQFIGVDDSYTVQRIVEQENRGFVERSAIAGSVLTQLQQTGSKLIPKGSIRQYGSKVYQKMKSLNKNYEFDRKITNEDRLILAERFSYEVEGLKRFMNDDIPEWKDFVTS